MEGLLSTGPTPSSLTWCEKINKENNFTFINLLNEILEEKIGTLKQIKLNEIVRIEERKTL